MAVSMGSFVKTSLGLTVSMFRQSAGWTRLWVALTSINSLVRFLRTKRLKGIFITTSAFTRDALASKRDYSSRIVLIDGVQLAEYMIDYGVGVSVTDVLELKKIDSDFFEDDL